MEYQADVTKDEIDLDEEMWSHFTYVPMCMIYIKHVCVWKGSIQAVKRRMLNGKRKVDFHFLCYTHGRNFWFSLTIHMLLRLPMQLGGITRLVSDFEMWAEWHTDHLLSGILKAASPPSSLPATKMEGAWITQLPNEDNFPKGSLTLTKNILWLCVCVRV